MLWKNKCSSEPRHASFIIIRNDPYQTYMFFARSSKEHVGLVGIIPDYYERGVAWFRGAFVLPEHREKRIGSALMSEISRFAKTLGQTKMVVYTFSYLDSLAPGALLYLKTGGKIE